MNFKKIVIFCTMTICITIVFCTTFISYYKGNFDIGSSDVNIEGPILFLLAMALLTMFVVGFVMLLKPNNDKNKE